jgi:hypothetical protein
MVGPFGRLLAFTVGDLVGPDRFMTPAFGLGWIASRALSWQDS